MTNAFSPAQAAQIARGVYALLDQSISQARERGDRFGCEGMFKIEDTSRFTGRSGGLIVCRALSGFGYIAEGEGRYQGEILIATRGTNIPLDWLSNFNIGLQLGPGGHPVHAGFHEVWKSFSGDIAAFLRGRNPSVIHCVGHSLGGALATLNADYLTTVGAGSVRLYTFGAPRAGALFFSRSLSSRVGSEHIFRVHHPADPVPKIPLFPFLHVPTDTGGYQLSKGAHGLISTSAHSMLSYIPAVGGDGWLALARLSEDQVSASRTQNWLDEVAAGGGGIIPLSARVLQMIGKALAWLLGRTREVVVGAIGIGLAAGMTVLDQLAWMLSKGAELSIEISKYVGSLIAAIFRFLGRAVVTGVSLTIGFIRWVLDLLYSALSAIATRALALLG